jgi:glucose/arabinose dehydrogenase
VAYHGSWNRTVLTGYKVVRYKLDAAGNFLDGEDFITGWLTPAGALGRPVDNLIKDDGVIVISDDQAGVVYRVVYRKM